MHSDERRDPEKTSRQLVAEALSNPESQFETIPGAHNRQEESEALLKRLTNERIRAEEELEFTRRALERSRDENSKLKLQLKKLRSSRTMKAGQLALSPLKFGRSIVTEAVPRAKDAVAAVRAGSFPGRTATERSADEQVPREARRLELLAAVGGRATVENLDDAITFLWEETGEITQTFQLIDAHRNLVGSLPQKTQILCRRVEGAYRLMNQDLKIPERIHDCVYVPEEKRVMYAVHSTPAYNSNGYSTRTKGVADGMVAAGLDVVVVARSGYPWDSSINHELPESRRTEVCLGEVPYIHVPGGNLNTTPLDEYLLVTADAYVREARRNRPALIQAASNHRHALAGLIAARRVGVPFVYEVRGLWEVTEASSKPGFEDTERFAAQVALENLVASEADAVLAITSQIADELVNRGVDRERIVIVPNAVDPRVFLPLPKDSGFATARGVDLDLPTIGFAGSFAPYEGLDDLLKASAILDERGVAHQIALAGSGAAEKQLRDLVREDRIRNVHFLGRLPMEDIPRLMSVFDVVACPRTSLPVTELVSPLKPLESFATATATVVSDVAPNLDLAGADAQRALVSQAGDPVSLADALETLLTQSDLRRAIARAGRLWTVRERNWEALGKIIAGAHNNAREHYHSCAEEGRKLEDLRVGLIADEFTTSTLGARLRVVPLRRKEWREQIKHEDFDVLLVESAWHGNHGDWHRGIGHYSDEESADLRELLDACRDKTIPTVFWNKEDPVHFRRFRENAALFDHVFTTDANKIPDYLATAGQRNRTVSSLSFWAEPAIHNPLPAKTRGYRNTVSYAGTYYGKRYPERSQRLLALLSIAEPFGLDIYDRQADDQESPYRFPENLLQYVRGGLPYEEVIDSYKTHLAHLNVNSVTDSPTMFSRRVVEIAASGGVVLSSAGRGIEESLGSTIAMTSDEAIARAWLFDWTRSPAERVREIWMQLRTVYRSHTSDTALAIMMRTAGIPVAGLPSHTWAAQVSGRLDSTLAGRLAAQSIAPGAVAAEDIDDAAAELLARAGIPVISENKVAESTEWVLLLPAGENMARTLVEDLLTATRFGDYQAVMWRVASDASAGKPLAREINTAGNQRALIKSGRYEPGGESTSSSAVEFLIPPLEEEPQVEVKKETLAGKTVLLAGHDFKFTGELVDRLEESGAEVLMDHWESHTQHDETRSAELLAQSDIIFCEWGLGNAVWYSERVRSHQKLVVRVHLQELFRPFLREINHEAVDSYIFVGELIRSAAVISHRVPEEKTTVIPNLVDVDSLARPKTEDAATTVGLVGIVPERKRLDLALDLITHLREHDDRFRLRIKGKLPSEYAWMRNRPDEAAYYDQQMARIEVLNEAAPDTVILDGYGDDMEQWYQNVGHALSVSDFESFHLTLADGAASGARPASLAWDGADLIYPDCWLKSTVEELAKGILAPYEGPQPEQFVREHFAQDLVLDRILDELR